jgi:alpha-1,6-mannosyltransferase
MLCAALLHTAQDRSDAIWLLPVLFVWGCCAIVGRTPELGPGPLLIAGLLCRLPLVGTPLHLSDDLFRYLWEGTALLHGHNVFLHPPADALYAGLDDALRAQVNHPEVPSVYPPLSLWWFQWLSLGRTPASVQMQTALLDLAVPLALQRAMGHSKAAWIYALHPLPALEAASGAHLDLVAVALAAAGLAAWKERRDGLAFGLTAAGALLKLLPGAWLPLLLLRAPRRHAALWVAAAGLGSVLLSWPVVRGLSPSEWPLLLAGWRAYAGHWEFNGLLYPWLAPWVGSGTRPVLIAVGASATIYAWARYREPLLVWSVVGTTFLFTSPTVHPWYVVWALVPSLMTGSRAWAWASLPLMGSYSVLLAFDPVTGAWSEAPWLWWSTWPPALLLLGLCWAYERREASPTAP